MWEQSYFQELISINGKIYLFSIFYIHGNKYPLCDLVLGWLREVGQIVIEN